MWLYPEVMPAKRRRRIRLWMVAVLGFAGASCVIGLAMPRASHASTDGPARAHAQRIPTCDTECQRERDEQVRFRRDTVARLHALRARISLVPQGSTGVSLPPACLETPLAKGCS